VSALAAGDDRLMPRARARSIGAVRRSRHHLLIDGTGIPLAWALTSGNRNDASTVRVVRGSRSSGVSLASEGERSGNGKGPVSRAFRGGRRRAGTRAHRGRGSYLTLWLSRFPLENSGMELAGLEPATSWVRSRCSLRRRESLRRGAVEAEARRCRAGGVDLARANAPVRQCPRKSDPACHGRRPYWRTDWRTALKNPANWRFKESLENR